jgi:hypothetical protein
VDLLSAREQPPLIKVDDEFAERQSHCVSAHMMARVWDGPVRSLGRGISHVVGAFQQAHNGDLICFALTMF